MRRSLVGFLPLPLLIALISACGGSTEPGPPVGEIQITPDSITLPQLGTEQLQVTVLDTGGTVISGAGVRYSSSDGHLVTVGSSGVVTSVGPAGSAVVTVRAGAVSVPVPVTVNRVATGIAVTPTSVVVQQLGSQQLTAHIVDAIGDPIGTDLVSFASSNEQVARVTSAGFVTSVGPAQTATITLTGGSFTKPVGVVVVAVPTRLTATPSTMTLSTTGSGSITARVLDAVGAAIPAAPITYTSSNPAIVEVSAGGFVQARGTAGGATITVRSGSLTAFVNVTVQ